MDDRTINLSVGMVIGFLLVACLCVGCLLGIWLLGSPKSPLAAMIASATPSPTLTPTPTFTFTPTSTSTATPRPTETPLPTDTPLPSNTPTLQASDTPVATATGVPELLLNDPFSDNSHEWEKWYDSNVMSVGDGQVRLYTEKEGFVALATCGNECGPYRNFYYQAEVSLSPDADVNYGIAFNIVDGKNYYVFEVNTNYKGYAFYKLVDGEWAELIAWKKHSAVKTGDIPNVLSVQVSQDGKLISLWLNDVFLQNYTESELLEPGKVGFYINGSGAELVGDNVELYTINPFGTP